MRTPCHFGDDGDDDDDDDDDVGSDIAGFSGVVVTGFVITWDPTSSNDDLFI